MRGRRNQHFWTYAGVSKGTPEGNFKGEIAYCDLCDRYAMHAKDPQTKGFTFITKKMYRELLIPGSKKW